MAIFNIITKALCLGFVFTTLYIVSYIIYNLFFHPLRRFPGPILMRATRATACYRLWRGTLSFDMLDIHKRYGDVVRIAPDELAYADPAAWKEIMGHRVGGIVNGARAPLEFEKTDTFYLPVANLPRDIITALGPEHAMLRRSLSYGFSDRSLREQQPVILKYVDMFIAKLREIAEAPSRESYRDEVGEDASSVADVREKGPELAGPVNLALWYNYCTFDIIGDLAFGEPFGCLEEGDLHPWVRTIFQMIRLGVALQTANHFSVLRRFITVVMSTKAMRERKLQHLNMTMDKLKRRIALAEREGPRADLMEGLLKKKDAWNLSLRQLESNASMVILAGSETTATLLSGVTYLLLRNSEKMEKLVREVRTTFKKEEDIDLTSVNKLAYMLACLDEALRVYPPVPTGLPRTVPEGGATIRGEFVPEKTIVAVHQWAMYHNEANFKNPSLFHPERALGDPEYASDRREAFQPFHIGPRNCLGRNLAYAEMRIVLARLLWNFDLVLAEDSRAWMETQKIYTLWEKGPLNVYLKPAVGH
ncbi:cytochrome P450 [Colletotrichum orchidophilum]|uniref:Cytochrome P450 n=1 Tax=Colletotrichum orchidophilum TaxID=1209926 RepID=A0A1G4AX63_9PEZI|nr:cytochrome P450 [Colletotrichum orchidophilum]OHE93749.1 cytochrome P450 [Colletotrichum orchidophilum]